MFTITYYFFRNCFFNSFLFNWNICENLLYFVRKYFMAISIFHYNFYIVQYFWKNNIFILFKILNKFLFFFSKFWLHKYLAITKNTFSSKYFLYLNEIQNPIFFLKNKLSFILFSNDHFLVYNVTLMNAPCFFRSKKSQSITFLLIYMHIHL